MNLCICVCMCVCVYIYIYIYICMYVFYTKQVTQKGAFFNHVYFGQFLCSCTPIFKVFCPIAGNLHPFSVKPDSCPHFLEYALTSIYGFTKRRRKWKKIQKLIKQCIYSQTCSNNHIYKTITHFRKPTLSLSMQIPIQPFLYKTTTCLK